MLESIRAVKRRGRLAGGRHLIVAVVASLLVTSSPPVRASGGDTDGSAGDGDVPIASSPSPVGDVRYTLGRGLRLGDSGVTLGGYSNATFVRDEGRPALLKLDDLSFFLTWDPTTRLHLFSELELEDLVQFQVHEKGGNPDYQFNAERLYADFAVSDSVNVRVGKFLTPVGRWNVIHAQPLVWTTSRPLVTETPFDTHTTGAMIFGTLFPGTGTVAYELYGQGTDQLDPSPTPLPADRSGGGRLTYAAPWGWSVGASCLAAERNGAWRHLGGIDGFLERDRFELMGEAVVEDGERRRDEQAGLYLQGAFETFPRLFLVGRYEHWELAHSGPPHNLFVGGLAYRPYPWLVLKAEYLAADHPAEEEPPGFKSSVAVLF